jgi:hypothetical protein
MYAWQFSVEKPSGQIWFKIHCPRQNLAGFRFGEETLLVRCKMKVLPMTELGQRTKPLRR